MDLVRSRKLGSRPGSIRNCGPIKRSLSSCGLYVSLKRMYWPSKPMKTNSKSSMTAFSCASREITRSKPKGHYTLVQSTNQTQKSSHNLRHFRLHAAIKLQFRKINRNSTSFTTTGYHVGRCVAQPKARFINSNSQSSNIEYCVGSS